MFAGMERDAETDRYHTLFRQQAPNLARWLSPDPLAGDVTNPQSLNRFTYVQNNPCNFTDPLGLQSGAYIMIICTPPEYQFSGPPDDQTVNQIRPSSCTAFFIGGGGGGSGGSGPLSGDFGANLPPPSLPRILFPYNWSQPECDFGPCQAQADGWQPFPLSLAKQEGPPIGLKDLVNLAKGYFCGTSFEDAVLTWTEFGATKGAATGAYAGFFGGELAGGLAGVPGAILGGYIGAHVGAIGGAFWGIGAAGACSGLGVYKK